MSQEPTLFDLPESPSRADFLRDWPEWFPVGKNTPATQRTHVARGLHPFGQQLHGDEALRCRDCAHALTRDAWGDRVRYPKCAIGPQSNGLATDLRLRWRACVLFQAKEAAG